MSRDPYARGGMFYSEERLTAPNCESVSGRRFRSWTQLLAALHRWFHAGA